jgi:hypothetical protein
MKSVAFDALKNVAIAEGKKLAEKIMGGKRAGKHFGFARFWRTHTVSSHSGVPVRGTPEWLGA